MLTLFNIWLTKVNMLGRNGALAAAGTSRHVWVYLFPLRPNLAPFWTSHGHIHQSSCRSYAPVSRIAKIYEPAFIVNWLGQF